jgi:hypothetical protein
MRFSALIKSLVIFVSLLFVFLLVKTPSFAQTITPQAPQITTTTATQPNLVPETDAGVPNNLHTFSQSLMLEILSSLSCNLSGKDPLSKNGQCLGYNSTTGKIGYVQNNGGALGAMSGMIAILYTPPLHTSDFIAYMGQNFGLAKHSYAAQTTGQIGFDGLLPLLNAWVVFRNVVYLLFVFIFIMIGLAIMLRVRIDPRTVMTIQNQIPKIIISLILVTFSFAIAGFLIDLMWVSVYVVINLMHQADPKIMADAVSSGIYHPAPQFANDVLNSKDTLSLGGIHSIAYSGAAAIKDIVQQFIRPETLGNPVTSNGGSGSTGLLGTGLDLNPLDWPGMAVGAIGDIIGSVVSQLVSWVVGIVAYLILIIALLIALIKLWFALLKAYISILIDVIFAPFWIISGLIPGTQGAGFSAWIRDMAGNLAAFPAAIMMFLLAKLFSDSFGTATVGGVSIGGSTAMSSTNFIPPLIGSSANNYIANLIAIGVVLATPGIVDMTKKAFKAPKLDLGPMGQNIGAAVGLGKKTAGTFTSLKREGKETVVTGTDAAGNAQWGQRHLKGAILHRFGFGGTGKKPGA